MTNATPITAAVPKQERATKQTDSPAAKEPAPSPVTVGNGNQGPRKLVRPTLPARALGERYVERRSSSPMLAHQSPLSSNTVATYEATHAEAFYFQKQMQTQTMMVFVLEDGEQIEGTIEWYDRNVIKVKHRGTRTMIYKSSVKYLFKAGEGHL
jgi:sRNA-binding regulator protein Hfq